MKAKTLIAVAWLLISHAAIAAQVVNPAMPLACVVTQADATGAIQSGQFMPSMDVAARHGFIQGTDGTNSQSYTASGESKVSLTSGNYALETGGKLASIQTFISQWSYADAGVNYQYINANPTGLTGSATCTVGNNPICAGTTSDSILGDHSSMALKYYTMMVSGTGSVSAWNCSLYCTYVSDNGTLQSLTAANQILNTTQADGNAIIVSGATPILCHGVQVQCASATGSGTFKVDWNASQ